MAHNFTLTGDEARTLMLALATSSAAVPSQSTIKLWTDLSEISQVQPPKTPEKIED
jgi:hypothetical protein